MRGRFEPGVRLPRIEERLGERSAVCGTQADGVVFLDGANSRVMYAGDHKIRQCAPLQLGGSLEQRLLIAGDPRLQPLVSRLGLGFC